MGTEKDTNIRVTSVLPEHNAYLALVNKFQLRMVETMAENNNEKTEIVNFWLVGDWLKMMVIKMAPPKRDITTTAASRINFKSL